VLLRVVDCSSRDVSSPFSPLVLSLYVRSFFVLFLHTVPRFSDKKWWFNCTKENFLLHFFIGCLFLFHVQKPPHRNGFGFRLAGPLTSPIVPPPDSVLRIFSCCIRVFFHFPLKRYVRPRAPESMSFSLIDIIGQTTPVTLVWIPPPFLSMSFLTRRGRVLA